MAEIPKADPASSPRIGFSGEVKRDRALFTDHGDDWKVTVTPLPDASSEGRKLDGGGRAARTLFEVRAEYQGDGLPAFEPVTGGVRRCETWNTPDKDLALAVAQMASRALHGSVRNIYLPAMAEAAKAP